MFAIKASLREKREKLNVLRKSGKIPAVFYGAGQDTTSISIPNIEFKKVWREAGESSAVKITAPGGDIDALIHEVQVRKSRSKCPWSLKASRLQSRAALGTL